MDTESIPERVREEVYKYFPRCRQALLKTGGHFPYLSEAAEFNMLVEVHMRAAVRKLQQLLSEAEGHAGVDELQVNQEVYDGVDEVSQQVAAVVDEEKHQSDG
jgi:hypothetical protein